MESQFFKSNTGVPKMENGPKKRWTKEEIDKGEDILSAMKQYDTAVISKYGAATMAARSLGLLEANRSFKDLPSGIKQYLQYVWWLDTPEGQSSILKKKVELAEEEWINEYNTNPKFRAAMNPENYDLPVEEE